MKEEKGYGFEIAKKFPNLSWICSKIEVELLRKGEQDFEELSVIIMRRKRFQDRSIEMK